MKKEILLVLMLLFSLTGCFNASENIKEKEAEFKNVSSDTNTGKLPTGCIIGKVISDKPVLGYVRVMSINVNTVFDKKFPIYQDGTIKTDKIIPTNVELKVLVSITGFRDIVFRGQISRVIGIWDIGTIHLKGCITGRVVPSTNIHGIVKVNGKNIVGTEYIAKAVINPDGTFITETIIPTNLDIIVKIVVEGYEELIFDGRISESSGIWDMGVIRIGTEINFPDIGLRRAVEEALSKPQGEPITTVEALRITVLNAQGRGIGNLEGIQYLGNLCRLNLYMNDVTDISRLEGLTLLQYLCLANNQGISNIESLRNLTGIQELYIQNTTVSSIAPIAGLVNLLRLDIYHCNNISNISYLSGMIHMQRLSIGLNQITDISVLSNMPELLELYNQGNPVNTLIPVQNAVNLNVLDISNTNITNIEVLNNMHNIRTLAAYHTPISSITALADKSSLRYLNILETPNLNEAAEPTRSIISTLRGFGCIVLCDSF